MPVAIRFPSICEVYGRYLKEGFLNWLLHVSGRRSTTDEQRNYGEVITKKLTLIFSAPLQRLLSGRLGCLRMNGMKLDIHHRISLGTVSGDTKMRSPFLGPKFNNILLVIQVIQEYISFISNNCTSQCDYSNRDTCSFFANRPIKFKVERCNRWKL